MKECPLKLVGMACDELKPDRCILMRNEGFGDGLITKLQEYFQNESSSGLERYVQAHSPGGQYGEKCAASPIIVDIATKILDSRGLEK